MKKLSDSYDSEKAFLESEYPEVFEDEGSDYILCAAPASRIKPAPGVQLGFLETEVHQWQVDAPESALEEIFLGSVAE